jgi:hypothetical protein
VAQRKALHAVVSVCESYRKRAAENLQGVSDAMIECWGEGGDCALGLARG